MGEVNGLVPRFSAALLQWVFLARGQWIIERV